MTILIFVNKSQSMVLVSFAGLSFVAIILQSFYALRSLNTSLSKANYSKHRSYLISKALYISINSLKLCFQTSDLQYLKDFSLFLIDLVWTIFEAYWAFVLYIFCYKISIGFYEHFEGILEGDSITHRMIFKEAIIIEVYGKKITKSDIEFEPSFPLCIYEQKKNKVVLNEKYLKVKCF